MRALRLGCLACLFAALVACAGTPDSRTEEADLALRRGDPQKAAALYEKALAARPGDPLLAEKLAVARTEAADLHLQRARELASAGRHEDARGEIELARRWTPDDPRIDDREAELARLETVTRTGIEEAVASAEASLDRGEAGAALAALARAKARYGRLPAILQADARVRGTVTGRLVATAEAALGADRPALATLLYRAAVQVSGSPSAGVAKAEAAFASELRATAAIEDVTDSTGGRASPSALAARLSAELGDHLPSPAWAVATGGEGELRVTVAVTRVDVGDLAPRTERRQVEYVLRVEQRENREKAKLRASEQLLVRSLGQARSVHDATAEELRSLERIGSTGGVHSWNTRRYGVYSEAAYYRYLGEARAREFQARNAVDDLDAQLTQTRKRIASEPEWNEAPIKASATTDVTVHRRTAAAEASVTLVTVTGETSLPIRAEVTATDESHAEIAASGIPADPISLPDEAEISRLALDALAGRIAETVAEKAAEMRRGLLEEAGRLERAGDRRGALDRYVAFLLAAGEGLPIERGRAAGELETRTGIRLAGSGMDLGNLRID